ncbi:autotransporter domain-containing protein [Candidatus Tisiphia endosymbiont of Nemotelus uliginosus]|uniref:autotransporter domain-containing protein n=1 Tax=Candidatus Tisiphia endosymbiont of Nemotelus uliginosus TaxID=3077926 RepID=UPI0035C9373E
MHANAHNNVLHPVEQFYTADIGGDYMYNHTKTISKKELGIKKADTGIAYAQINYKMNENFNLGLQLNGAKSNMDFKNGHGKADMKEYLVSIHGTYKFDNPIFVYAAIGAGQIKYDIKRKIALGLATNLERGKPSGAHYLGTIGVGYNYINESKLVVTPFFNVNYQEVSLKSYKESGNTRSTTMEFNIPNRKSLITEIGATLAQDYKVQDNLTLIPSLTLSYGYECINTIKKHAKGRVSDMPAPLRGVPTYKVNESNFTLSGEVRAKNDSYLSYGVRASMQLTKRTKQYSAGLFAGVTF